MERTRTFYQLKRLERVVLIDGVLQYFWRYSDRPMISTPEKLTLKCYMRARLDTDRRCNIQARRYHAEYVKLWGEISYKETLDPVGQRWSAN